MSTSEQLTSPVAPFVAGSMSLFDLHNANLTREGSPIVTLLPEGYAPKKGKTRPIDWEHANSLSNLFGSLIRTRMFSVLEAPVLVAQFALDQSEGSVESEIARIAVSRAHNHLGVSWLYNTDLPAHFLPDESGRDVCVREAELVGGWFVSTHIGASACKVVLGAESTFTTTSF